VVFADGVRHDISRADTPLEGGLAFAVAWDKPGGFIGCEALNWQQERGVTRQLVQFALDDPDTFAYHDEPIYRDGDLVGRLSSAAYGHTLGRAVGLGYVTASAPGIERSWFTADSYEIEVAAERVPAQASLRPMYDPESRRGAVLTVVRRWAGSSRRSGSRRAQPLAHAATASCAATT
jgi:glycine cleavage system aminomethyltransferase T